MRTASMPMTVLSMRNRTAEPWVSDGCCLIVALAHDELTCVVYEVNLCVGCEVRVVATITAIASVVTIVTVRHWNLVATSIFIVPLEA